MPRILVAGLATIAAAACGLLATSTAVAQAPPFEKVLLIEDTQNPFELDIAGDGRVFYIERWGDLRVWDPQTEDVETIGHIEVYTGQENGLMGLALAPDFDESDELYLSYSAPPQSTLTQRVSRFTLDPNGQLDLSSEQVIYEWTHQRDECCHSAGALEFGPDGSLFITTGDNTNPFASNGYTPIDERPGREAWDAQRTSANTNDPNGKVLRIVPNPSTPGHTIPEGNMFAPGTPNTLPEIYAMGFRNPFRFKVDPETGWVLLGDYGPDAAASNEDRGPQGSVEFNVVTAPGYFGWPYCVRQNTPFIDFQFPSGPSGAPFDCANPVNESPNNTGLTELPPAIPATMWMGYTETDDRFPNLGGGGAPMGGPRYHFDPENPAETKFPEEYDGKWFIGEWNNSWIKTATLDEEGNATDVEDFPDLDYRRPMDMKFGPDGSLYLIEWGSGFDGGQNGNPDSAVYRIDYVEPSGPQVTADADPRRGPAPLEVTFDGEATDPEGNPDPDFEYEWDFGDGSPASDEEDPAHTYTEPGTYEATLTVTDPDTDEQGTASVTIRVDPQQQCQRTPRSDEFEGDALDESKWTVIRPDDTHPFSVSDGELHLPIDNGSIYGPGTSARNIIVQPLPSGEVAVTAKVRVDELTEDYHQAGLRVYADDDNWASVHMIHAGGQRDIEFIYESNGNPRNEAADKLGGIPEQAPHEYYVRIISDGQEMRAEYSYDGEVFDPVGRPGSLDTFESPMIGPVALSDAAPSVPMSHFDWIRFDPDVAADTGPSDEFSGTTLDKGRWNAIVRENPDTWDVADGQLTITTETGDLYTGDTDPPPNNIMLQDAANAGEDWTIETKLSATFTDGYSQAGLMAYVGGDDYVKFNAIADAQSGRINRIELRSEIGAEVQNPQPNADVPEGTTDIWLRLAKEGATYSGEYSFDGEDWTEMEDAVTNPMEAPAFGLFAFGVQFEGDEASFDYFRVDGEPGADDPCACLIPEDEFDGDALDPERWNAIVREDPELYRLDDGVLWIETTPGDIYETSDPTTTRNFILQSPDNAGEDWSIETKVLGGNLGGGYAQGGLMAYADDGNYVKLDLISDENNPQVNRIELRSEVGDAILDPQPQFTGLPGGTEDAWLRLTKEGTTYTGEYSFDGESWEALDEAVTNPMEAPAFGLFTFGGSLAGTEVGFEYFGFEGEASCPDENGPPVIDDVTATPSGGFAPLEVGFEANATDPDGDDLTYAWDFGDGETSNEQNPTHTYTEAGEFEAEVSVSDGQSERSRSVTITVLPEDDPQARFRALVFSKTTVFRHDSIPAGHAAIDELAEEHDFQVDHTEDASLFRPEVLERYDTVVFLSTTGDVLNESQQAAFEGYIQGGGGYAGIHAASDTEYDWNWYGHLVGAYFLSHPPGTANAAIDVEDHEHPSTATLPDRYERVDEWYNFKSPDFQDVGEDDYSPRGDVHVLATVDESTYDEQDGNATDDDHPITWCHRYDGGRSWYTAMGHTIESYSEENFLTQVLGGLETTAGVEPSETCGLAPGADTTDPETTASLDPEEPGPGGTYDGPVEVTLSATDPAGGAEPTDDDPSGVAWTEYRVNTNGSTGEWTRAENDNGDDPFVTAFTVEDEGSHQVQFRSEDVAGNREPTRSVSFSIAGEPGPCVERSDEFDAPELNAELWSFKHPTSDDAAVAGGSLVLPLGALELDGANTGPIGLIAQEAPAGGFEVVAKLDADIAADDSGENGYAQAGLMLYQTDDNFVKAGRTRVGIFQPELEGQTYFEAGAETDGDIVRSGQLGMSDSHPTTWWTRLVRSGNEITAWYSLSDPADGGTWIPIPVGGGMNANTIMPPGNGPIYVGVFGANGSIDVSADYVRFTPDQDCPDADTEPPMTTALLVPTAPGPGGTYETPVTVVFTATDGEDGSGVAETRYRVDGGPWEVYNPFLPPVVAAPGEHQIEYHSVDEQGNEEEVRSVSFTIAGEPGDDRAIEIEALPPERRVGKGKKQVGYRLRVTNSSAEGAALLSLCTKVQTKRLRVIGPACRPASVPAGETVVERYRYGIKKKARGKRSRIRFDARGPGFETQRTSVWLEVRR